MDGWVDGWMMLAHWMNSVICIHLSLPFHWMDGWMDDVRPLDERCDLHSFVFLSLPLDGWMDGRTTFVHWMNGVICIHNDCVMRMGKRELR